LRCNPEGNIIWESGFPDETIYRVKRTDHEIYVLVKLEDNMVLATSFSGFIDYIEVETGKIIKSVFVK
jgi:hypothetical protein